MYRELIEALESLSVDPDEVPREGIVGGEDDNGNYAINVIDDPNRIYVQFIDGSQPQTEAINFGVPLIPEFPVLIYYRNKEPYAVIDPERSLDFRANNEGLGNVAPHSHEPGLGLFDLVSTRRMKEGIVTVTLPYSMAVDVEGFKFLNPTTGEERWFPGGSLELGGYVPSTSDTHRWVKVGFDPFVEELVAASGVEYVTPIALSEEQLAEIAFENKMSLAGIELYNTVTAIDDDKLIHDWRFFLNTIVTGVGGGDASGGDVNELADLDDVLSAAQTANYVFAVGDGVTGGLLRTRLLVDADIPQLNASHIDSGTFDVARIPDLDAAKITTGTFDPTRIPGLDTSKIITGELDLARGGLNADVSAYDGLVAIFGGITENIKCEFEGTTDPTATDDVDAGYTIGSIWINTVDDTVWICTDDASDNAVWVDVSAGGSGSTITVKDVDENEVISNVDTLIFPNFTLTDNLDGSATYEPRLIFHALKMDTTLIPFDSSQGVVFSNELLDTDGYIDLGADDDRFTIPSGQAGWYKVNVLATLLDIDTTLQTGWANVTVTHQDGGSNPQIFYSTYFDFATITGGTYAPSLSFELLLDMDVGDYVFLTIEPNTTFTGDIYLYLLLTATKVGET